MLSLIVALPPTLQATDGLQYALSRTASAGLQQNPASSLADTSLPEHGAAPLALLQQADEVVAVVPVRGLSWHRVARPRVSSARMRAALDGMLEDRVLEDPQTLHFALAPGAAPGQATWVAACDRAWLHSHLHAFEVAGRRVARVVPEYAPLAEGSRAVLHVTGTPESVWVVRCADDGVQTLPLTASSLAMLDLEGASQPTAEPAVAAIAEQAFGRPVLVRHAAQGLLDAARTEWDMAQFDLTSTGGTRAARRAAQAWAQWWGSPAWRPARWGLAALLLVHVAGLNAWAWKERSMLQARRAESRDLLTRTFPKVQLVVDAPVQMEREVAVLRQATGALSDRDLEPMLAAVAERLAPMPAPSAVDFSAGELTLKGFAVPSSEAGALAQRLTAAGYASRTDGDSWTIKPRGAGQVDSKPDNKPGREGRP